VAEQARACQAVLSVCTGSFVLHAAGLLAGRKATTHWASLARLRALGDVEVVEERFTRDGPIWCGAGVSAGIDLTLRFIAETAGEAAAGQVQFAAEYVPSDRVYGDIRQHPQAPRYMREG
jgi:transcriptional regulator GlxA family with amidase domain